jgi:putative redox protein
MALVIVRSRGGSNVFKTDVRAGSHSFTADEPPGEGGPSPYDLLVGALGSCTAMSVELYALKMGWPLEHVVVRLRHDRLHAKDSANDAPDSFLDHIEREISLEGPLNDEQRKKLLDVAERCPVNRVLSSNVRVDTTLSASSRSGAA